MRSLGPALLLASACAALAASAEDSPWPREFTTAKGNQVVVYQPQVETLTGQTLTARAAVSVIKKDEPTPRFGVVFFSARASVDRDARTVSVRSVKVSRVRFPNITDEKEKRFAAILEEAFPKWNVVISYDRVLESLHAAQLEQKSAQGLKHDPPKILFADEPTVLVTLDGEPQLRDVEDAPLKVVVNTPFLIVLDARDSQYYLSGGKSWWYRASNPKGPWQAISGPPSEIAQMKARADAQKKESSASKGAAAKPEDDGTEGARPPKIRVATEPTELIVSEGKPSFKSVAGTDLLYLDNSESDVIMDTKSQTYYTLLSGRWFKSRTLASAAWTYVPPDALPPSFSKIPANSDLGDVLASVPGTDEAEDAVLDAQIPETTAVKRSEAKLDVEYDGEPSFTGVEGSETEYAVNTPTSVLKIRGRYYACDNAVWYVSDSPTGPWLLADSVPRDEIDALPPSVPVYNAKYVQIYDATPDEVYYGYTQGYVGCYPWYGTVVWGTGWYYRPWIGSRFFWPRPYTWGFRAHFTPWTGWGFGSSWSYPFFRASSGWGGAFRTAGWRSFSGGGSGWRRTGWWGPGGYRPPLSIVNNIHVRAGNGPGRPGYTRALPGGVSRIPGARANIGFRPPVRNVRPDRFVTNTISPRLPERTHGSGRPSAPDAWRSGGGRANNVYGDRNGEVYRRTSGGSWQQRDTSGWRNATGSDGVSRTSTGHPTKQVPERSMIRTAPHPELNRDFTARQRGENRVRESGGYRRGGGGGSSRGGSSGRGGGEKKH